MCTAMIDPQKPGKLAEINIKIPIRIGVLGLLASIAFALTFHTLDKEPNKKTLEFFTAVLGASAGITSAFYVGESIRLNAESKKLDRTTVFISRWSDPSFDSVRKAGHDIDKITKNAPAERHSDIIQQALEDDLDLKIRALDALNFLEVMALCMHFGIIEETVIHEYYRSIVQSYCKMFGLWIERLRIDTGNKQLFKHLTTFCDESRES
jgi:Domain of unknown function (DUF4760)